MKTANSHSVSNSLVDTKIRSEKIFDKKKNVKGNNQ